MARLGAICGGKNGFTITEIVEQIEAGGRVEVKVIGYAIFGPDGDEAIAQCLSLEEAEGVLEALFKDAPPPPSTDYGSPSFG